MKVPRGSGFSRDEATATRAVLSQALPEVFDRFAEAAARVAKNDLDSLLTTENLRRHLPWRRGR